MDDEDCDRAAVQHRVADAAEEQRPSFASPARPHHDEVVFAGFDPLDASLSAIEDVDDPHAGRVRDDTDRILLL